MYRLLAEEYAGVPRVCFEGYEFDNGHPDLYVIIHPNTLGGCVRDFQQNNATHASNNTKHASNNSVQGYANEKTTAASNQVTQASVVLAAQSAQIGNAGANIDSISQKQDVILQNQNRDSGKLDNIQRTALQTQAKVNTAAKQVDDLHAIKRAESAPRPPAYNPDAEGGTVCVDHAPLPSAPPYGT